MEYLDIVDEYGNPTGQLAERTYIHREGLLHRTSHVWIVRKINGRIQILLQKRCFEKDSFPGRYDISSAGHILPDDDYVSSALRELKEELGVTASEEDLIDCGLLRCKDVDELFHGERFCDRQIAKIFLLWLDLPESAFTLQKEEIDSVLWVDFDECLRMVAGDEIPNCIDMAELCLLRDVLAEEGV